MGKWKSQLESAGHGKHRRRRKQRRWGGREATKQGIKEAGDRELKKRSIRVAVLEF
jgi:hypothetical protein